MAESKLRTLSIDFAVQILNLVKFLKSQHETIVSNQIGRAGTSLGANIHEAQYAHGKPDFIAKLQITLKTPPIVTGWVIRIQSSIFSGEDTNPRHAEEGAIRNTLRSTETI